MEPVDKVLAVNWYRGNFEIFWFIADYKPPTKIFKLDNLMLMYVKIHLILVKQMKIMNF
jgi:hypothetical protein